MIFTASPHPAVAFLALAAILAWLWWQHRQPCFLLWALAWLVLAAHRAALAGAGPDRPWLAWADLGLVLLATALGVLGAAAGDGRGRGGRASGIVFGALVGAGAVVVGTLLTALRPGLPEPWGLGLGFFAAGWIAAGWLVWRRGADRSPTGAPLAGVALAGMGALQPIEWALLSRGAAAGWLGQVEAVLYALLAVGAALLAREEARAAGRVVARDVLDDDPNMIAVVKEGRYVFANRVLRRGLGLDLAALNERGLFGRVVPEDRERARRRHAERLAGRPVEDYEIEIEGAERRVPVLVHADPIDWEGGPALKYELLDLSGRREAEAEIRAVNEELQRINAELEKSNRLKSEFLSNTGHELKTPLTSIIANAEILEYEMCGPLNDEQRRVLSGIGRNSQHLLEMISRLLDFARREEGYDVLRYERAEIRALVDGVIRTVEPLLEGRDLELVVDLPEDLPPCWLDSEKVYRVFLNLVENAIKFSTAGRITIAARLEDGELEGSVADEGIGIPPDRVGEIFQAFQQVDASSTRPYQGVGLGLAICRQLVELHGGRIWAESRPGAGSVFRFRVPFHESDPSGD